MDASDEQPFVLPVRRPSWMDEATTPLEIVQAERERFETASWNGSTSVLRLVVEGLRNLPSAVSDQRRPNFTSPEGPAGRWVWRRVSA